MVVDRYSITTVAAEILAANMSASTKVTLSATPPSRASSLESATSLGSISIPTPRAPYFCAAMMTIRPSPDPRSYTMSSAPTPASMSMASAIGCRVGA